MNWDDKKILVTGAAGIAGQSMVRRLLKKGSFVNAVVGKKRKLEINHPRLRIESLDLLNYQNCVKVASGQDIVINFAAVINGANGQKTNQLQLVRDNVTLGVNIITAAVECCVKMFGFVGSSTMYPPWAIVDENDGFKGEPWIGYTGVGNMKRYLEKVCIQFHNESNTKFAIARTTALYGPYDDFNLETCHVIPAIINKISHKQNPLEIWGRGDEIRNFIYVEDFVDGFLKMIEHKCDADPVNITSGEESTIQDVINNCIAHEGYSPIIHYDITKPTMIPKRIVSVDKAKILLNWQATTSLKVGLQKTIDWYKDFYKL